MLHLLFLSKKKQNPRLVTILLKQTVIMIACEAVRSGIVSAKGSQQLF